MKLLKNNLKILKESFILAKNNLVYIFGSVLIDIVFLFLVGVSGSFILAKAIPYLEQFAAINVNAPSIVSMTDAEFSAFMAQSAEKAALSNQAFNIFLQFIAVIFVLWIIFQGINWFLAARCVKKEINFKKYFLNFSIISIISLLFSGLILFFIVNLAVKNIMSQNYFANTFFTNILTIILVAVILYFLFIGYATAHKHNLKEFLKNVFILGIKNFKNIIFAYAAIIVMILIINYILGVLYPISFAAMILAGMFILMPLIALSRIYLIKSIEK